jgi:hypothetical protein
MGHMIKNTSAKPYPLPLKKRDIPFRNVDEIKYTTLLVLLLRCC